jgi:hypothetical protein
MYLQIVTFHLKVLPEDAFRQACEQIAPAVADVRVRDIRETRDLKGFTQPRQLYEARQPKT